MPSAPHVPGLSSTRSEGVGHGDAVLAVRFDDPPTRLDVTAASIEGIDEALKVATMDEVEVTAFQRDVRQLASVMQPAARFLVSDSDDFVARVPFVHELGWRDVHYSRTLRLAKGSPLELVLVLPAVLATVKGITLVVLALEQLHSSTVRIRGRELTHQVAKARTDVQLAALSRLHAEVLRNGRSSRAVPADEFTIGFGDPDGDGQPDEGD
jgi:hypothetical protein